MKKISATNQSRFRIGFFTSLLGLVWVVSTFGKQIRWVGGLAEFEGQYGGIRGEERRLRKSSPGMQDECPGGWDVTVFGADLSSPVIPLRWPRRHYRTRHSRSRHGSCPPPSCNTSLMVRQGRGGGREECLACVLSRLITTHFFGLRDTWTVVVSDPEVLSRATSFLKQAADNPETQAALVALVRHVFTHQETLEVLREIGQRLVTTVLNSKESLDEVRPGQEQDKDGGGGGGVGGGEVWAAVAVVVVTVMVL